MTGIIVLWSGAIVNIPPGWALCDGTQGTPDLRNRFIVGAGDTYAVDASGGALTHSHGATVFNDTHNHDIVLGTHIHSLTEYGHTHDRKAGNDIEDVSPNGDFDRVSDTVNPGATTDPEFLDGTTDNDTHNHIVLNSFASHLPPYYALAYIMKL